MRLSVATGDLDLSDVQLGDSIAVSGCCLTAVALDADGFAADVSNETLSLTTLGGLKAGDPVNLEKALRLADRLGGHLVSGHVDGVGKVVSVRADGRSQRWTFEAPAALARYIAHKGSVMHRRHQPDRERGRGIALRRQPDPAHGRAHHLRARARGDAVNIEVDVVARYVERLLGRRGRRHRRGLPEAHGFA